MLETPVRVRVSTTPCRFLLWSRRLRCHTRDASVCGLQLRMDCPIPAGSHLCVWIDVQDGARVRTLRLRGTVAWCQPDSIGETFFVGLRLGEHPRRAAEIWSRTILDEIRRRSA